MVRQYETTFIVDAHLQSEQIEKTVSKYTQLIEKQGGKIKLLDRWGKRRLAYEIAKKQYGYYVYVRFEAEGTIVETLEKDFKLDDNIMRYLILKVSKMALREEAKDGLKPVGIQEEAPKEVKTTAKPAEQNAPEEEAPVVEAEEPEKEEPVVEAEPNEDEAEEKSESEEA